MSTSYNISFITKLFWSMFRNSIQQKMTSYQSYIHYISNIISAASQPNPTHLHIPTRILCVLMIQRKSCFECIYLNRKSHVFCMVLHVFCMVCHVFCMGKWDDEKKIFLRRKKKIKKWRRDFLKKKVVSEKTFFSRSEMTNTLIYN